MSRPTLIIFSIIVILLGALGMKPGPQWQAFSEIVIGIVGLIVGVLDKKKA